MRSCKPTAVLSVAGLEAWACMTKLPPADQQHTSPEGDCKSHNEGGHVLDEDAQPLTDRLLVGCCVVIQAAQECTCRHQPRAALCECVCAAAQCSDSIAAGIIDDVQVRHGQAVFVAAQQQYCWQVCDECHFVP